MVTTGERTVLIGGQRTARKGDKSVCSAALDPIAKGEPSVLVGGEQIARKGDTTEHKGVITQGQKNVLVGHQECMKKAAKKRKAFVTGNDDEDPKGEQPADGKAADGAGQGGARAIDVDKAVDHLNDNAHAKSIHRCGEYTRQAIEAGGVTLDRHADAKDYGSSLESVGFSRVADPSSMNGYAPQRGDVAVFGAPGGSGSGHMQMYNGSQWVSDFRQNNFLPGRKYGGTPYTIYRP